MKLFFILFLITNSLKADVVVPKKRNSLEHKKISTLITNIFYDELYKRIKYLKPKEVLKEKIKKEKFSVYDGKLGSALIEKIKEQNRQRIAAMRGFDPAQVKRGADLIRLKKNENKNILSEINRETKKISNKYYGQSLSKQQIKTWALQAEKEKQALKLKILRRHKLWKKKYRKTLKIWIKEKITYKDQISIYKKTLTEIPLVLPVSNKEMKQKVRSKIRKEYFIVSNSLEIKIRDQKRRPTCSSFAGIRAMEILLAQNNLHYDLSEQYLYWASKPNCQFRRCQKKGSWIGYGLSHSKKSSQVDIPLEQSCPYFNDSMEQNETQIPLKRSCLIGKVQIKSFSYLKNLDQVIESLKNNKSVLASLRLSGNFYNNNGLILEKDSNRIGESDQHAKGHAVLLIGFIKLPKVLNEGSICFITANSWGVGWGHGGYSCLSEKWILNHRKSNPFVVIDSLKIE